MGEHLLEVNHLHTCFRTREGIFQAVDDISLYLDSGEALGIVGESGCGKTTAALSIARLLPDNGFLSGGSIRLCGTDVASMTDKQLRPHRWTDVSLIFQGAMNALNPIMNIGIQIAEAIMLHDKLSRKAALNRVGELLECVDIPRDRIKYYPHEFSGGMKQRVMIAMALACHAKVVIGDEPTTALDVMVQAQILELLEKLRSEMKMGLILISHDLSVLSETCDRIAVMYAGKIVETGTIDDIYNRTAHPYTKALLACFPSIYGTKNIPDGIQGFPPSLINPPAGCRFHSRCPFASEQCRREQPTEIRISSTHYVSCHLLEGKN